jgi:DNA-binding transcriptional MerR regulator
VVRISELARRSGVPVATIKYYLREGLLPGGELTSATQATYADEHVARLRLIRALTVSGGLSVAVTKSVLEAIDAPGPDPLEVLGQTHDLLAGPPGPVDTTPAVRLLDELGWSCDEDFRGSTVALAQALAAVTEGGFEVPDGLLERYGRAMADVAEAEIANIPTESVAAAVRYVVLGTVLMEPVLLALRRLAESDAAVRRFGSGPATPT